MSDLVRRLRKKEANGITWTGIGTTYDGIYGEAADEIERLRSLVKDVFDFGGNYDREFPWPEWDERAAQALATPPSH